MEGGDAQTVIEQLTKKARNDCELFYREKLNEQGQLAILFLCDSMMRGYYIILERW